jgi:DNA-binding NarL/FixJ family response regulator
MPPPPAPVNAILLGPQGETRDWLASLLSARPEIRLLGAHAAAEDAANALKSSTGRKETAVLIDAKLRDPNEARSVIRMMRERFPTVRVVVYGNELDEIAIEGLYFLGADDVLLPQMQEAEDTAAIMSSVRKPVDAGVARIPEPQIEILPDAPRPDAGFLQVEAPTLPMEETAPAIEEATEVEEPAPAMEAPALPNAETTPAIEEPAPAIEAPAPPMEGTEEPAPAMEAPALPNEEAARAIEEPGPAMEAPAPASEEPAEPEGEPIRAAWRSRIQAIWKSPLPTMEEPTPTIEEPTPTIEEPQAIEEPAPAIEEPAPTIEEPAVEEPAPEIESPAEEPAPVVEAAQVIEESTPVREERAPAKEEAPPAKASRRPRRPLMRRLGLLRSQRRRHAGWIPNRAKPDKIRFEDDRVARNLERLVPPWQSSEEDAPSREEEGREGTGGPDDP